MSKTSAKQRYLQLISWLSDRDNDGIADVIEDKVDNVVDAVEDKVDNVKEAVKKVTRKKPGRKRKSKK